jgi:hypothetical protein
MNKTERFGLIITPAEKVAVQRLAEAEGGLTQAALIRRLIRTEAQRRGVWGEGQKVEVRRG